MNALKSAGGCRRRGLVVLGLVALAVVTGAGLKQMRRATSAPASGIHREARTDPGDSNPAIAVSAERPGAGAPAQQLTAQTQHPNPPGASTERARRLVRDMTGWNVNHLALTQAEAQALRQQFQELKLQGTFAVAAIREFLSQNEDLNFNAPDVVKTAGYPSLRLGFLDVLAEVGGPDAVDAALETLKSTGDPLEVATLAGIVEKNAPGQHHDEFLGAARDVLTLAASGQLQGQRIAPAFEVLQTYGSTDVLPFLQSQMSGKWRANAAIALAELPDGLGIPALIELARDPDLAGAGRGDVALRPLAQAARSYPEAFEALAELARNNTIPERAWPSIVSALAGSDFISNGTVLAEPKRLEMNVQAVEHRVSLLDRLAAATSNESASRLLQQQRTLLAGVASR
jgi:HEAT repeat protein